MNKNHSNFLALITLLCLGSISHAQTPREIAEHASPSVVLILAESKTGKPLALGSGFFITENVVATNSHVIKGAARLYAKFAGLKGLHAFDAVIANDTANDLALLRLRSVKGSPLSIGDESEVGVGDQIYVLGNPEGFESTFSQGNISGIRRLGGRRLFQITAPISHGSSGGPVLNAAGEVIGIAVLSYTAGQNLNFAIPVSDLVSLTARTISPPTNRPIALSNHRKAQEYYDLGERLKRNSQHVKAVEAYKQAIQFKPDYPEAFIGLGWAYHSARFQSHYTDTDAVAAFKEAVRLNPENANAYTGMGAAYEGLSLHAEAIEAYKQAIRVNPDGYNAYISLGRQYSSHGRYDDGIAAFKQAIRLNRTGSDGESAYSGLGEIFVKLVRYPEAIVAFKQAIACDANFGVSVYFALADTYESAKRPNEAAQILRQAVEVIKQQIREDRVYSMTYGDLGQAYERLGQLVPAAEAYQQAIDLNPEFAGVCMWLGRVLEKLGRHSEAIKPYKLSISGLRKGNKDGWKALAAVYIKLGKHAEALNCYLDWTRILPKNADAHYGLGLSYLQLGDKESALKEHLILKQLNVGLATQLFDQISR